MAEVADRIADEHADSGLPIAGVQATLDDAVADTADEVERQTLAQDAIDVAALAAMPWSQIGRDAFDPERIGNFLADYSHPEIEGPLQSAGAAGEVADRIRAEFTAGLRQARIEHCADERAGIIDQLSADPEVSALVTRLAANSASELSESEEFAALIRAKVTAVPAPDDLTRATVHDLLTDPWPARLFAEPAFEHADREHPGPFERGGAPAPGPQTAPAVDPDVAEDGRESPLPTGDIGGAEAETEPPAPEPDRPRPQPVTTDDREHSSPEVLGQVDEPASHAAAPDIEQPADEADTTLTGEDAAATAPVAYTGPAGADFVLGTEVRAPSSATARIKANIATIKLVRQLDAEGRPATPAEQEVLARWSGWGGAAEVFSRKPEFARYQAELRELLDDDEYRQARASTPNAHYTDPAIASAIWSSLERAGLPDGARLVEPGCGSGHFIGHRPAGVSVTGVELDPLTARIAHYLYPSQEIRNHGFHLDFAADNSFHGAIGNVPFGDYSEPDSKHNPNGLSVHNHFIKKALALTEPGGYVALITSAYTSDAAVPKARKEIAELGDLVGAVRLPSRAFARQAATDVVTDVLVFRRREPDRRPDAATTRWLNTENRKLGEGTRRINSYFLENPEAVLGTMTVGHGMHGRETLLVRPLDDGRSLADQLAGALDIAFTAAADLGLGLTVEVDATREAPPAGLVTGNDVEAEPIPGTLRYAEAAGVFEQYQFGAGWQPTPKKSKDLTAQWRRLLDMGDTVMALTTAGREGLTAAERQQLRDRLGDQYDRYVADYGHINRYAWTNHAERNSDGKAAAKYQRLETKWRHDNGDELTDEFGDPLRDDRGRIRVIPADGPLPDDVAADLWEKAYEPDQLPYKKRSHLEGAIKFDPRISMVRAIEHYNDETRTATKAAIFTEDTSWDPTPKTNTDSPAEAVALCFDQLGRVEPQRIADLLGTTVDEALHQARDLIYPSLDQPGEWELAPRVLSGNVRQKLAVAKALAADDPLTYQPVVEALTAVVPPDQDPSKIGVRPGSQWLGLETYQQFFTEEFDIPPDRITIELSSVDSVWSIEAQMYPNWADPTHGYKDDWGVEAADVSGVELFEKLCNNKPIESPKTATELDASPKPRFHPERTEMLRLRATQLEARFNDWLWSDPERTNRLVRRFNDEFNSFVQISYDRIAEHKTFPGLNTGKYDPYIYQRQAAVRLLNDETILLDHCVGAGKTLTMTLSCMELKRLGMARQPWVVVPNHLIDQWHREVLDAYPSANVLAASDLSGRADRQRFIAQTALADWDIVLVPESVFGLIGMSDDWKAAYIEKQIRALEVAAANAEEDSFNEKRLQKQIKRERDRHARLIEGKDRDPGLTFGNSGCDFLFVDEAHLFKNLTRPSNSADLNMPQGSQRASDLEMKAQYLREKTIERNILAGRANAPARALAFATGTPVSNSLAELWVMNRFLRPDLLEERQMLYIDGWSHTYAKPRTTVEMNITGTSLKSVTRMASYDNMPQLLAMVDQFRDVVIRDQIPAELPALVNGERTIMEFDLPQEVRDFMADLDRRMSMTSGDKMHIDNALKIGTDGRNATLYPPLAGLSDPDPEHNRIVLAANEIWRIHTDNIDVVTPADAAGPEATGVFQLVFCDRGTPKATDGRNARNVYTRLRDDLIARGMAREEIAFIHDYPTAKKKAELFRACRSGQIRVLIGSTEKMGTGTNVQRLAKALIHMDVPWRPSDLEQREGRILRQGNRMREVEIINIVARKSYDATVWQTVERKALVNTQLRTGDIDHSIEDIGGDIAVSAAHTKAAATGDPIYVAVVDKEDEVKALRADQKMVAATNASNAHALRQLRIELPIKEQEHREVQAMVEPVAEWLSADRADRHIIIDGTAVPDDDTTALAEHTQTMLRSRVIDMRVNKSTNPEVLFEIAGVPISGLLNHQIGALTLSMPGNITRVIERNAMMEAMSANRATHGLLQRVRNMLEDTPTVLAEAAAEVDAKKERLQALESQPELTFTRAAELAAAEEELARMKLTISARENSPEAMKQRAAERDRCGALGQYPRWTLDLNPTLGRAEEFFTDRETLKASVPARMAAAAEDWKHRAAAREQDRLNNPWQPVEGTDGHRHHYGGARDSGQPGATVQWTGTDWHWTAWYGNGAIATGVYDRRDSSMSAAERQFIQWKNEPPEPADDPQTQPEPPEPAVHTLNDHQAGGAGTPVAEQRVHDPQRIEPEPMAADEVRQAELRRLGEQAAQERPDWTAHIGPLPERPIAREQWIELAAQIAAYRQKHDITDPTTMLGDRPDPGLRAARWDQLTERATELRAAAATATPERPAHHPAAAPHPESHRRYIPPEPVQHSMAPPI